MDEVHTLIQALLAASTEEQFRRLTAEQPEVLGEATAEALREMANHPVMGPAFGPWLRLVEGARAEDPTTWGRFSEELAVANAIGKQVGSAVEELDLALANHRSDEAIAIATDALMEAERAGLALMVALLLFRRGQALLMTPGGDRAENVERALNDLQRALTIAPMDDFAAEVAVHAAIAHAERLRGDRAENIETAYRLLVRALDRMSAEARPELRGKAISNAATCLTRRERGRRVDNLREAIRLCREGIAAIDSESERDTWAFLQINMGVVVRELAVLGEGDLMAAAACYEAVIDSAKCDGGLCGAAHLSLAQLLRLTTDFDAEALLDASLAGGEPMPSAEEQQRSLLLAREHLESALPLLDRAPDPLTKARCWAELAIVEGRLDNGDEAINAGQNAVAELTPFSDPHSALNANWELASNLMKASRWDEAAAAFRTAVEASDIAFHSRLELESRSKESVRARNLSRWAAFSLARADEAEDAALVLENGRGREIRQRFGPTSRQRKQLDSVPQDLRDAYFSASEALATSGLGQAGAAQVRALQESLASIREMPGLEDFATGCDAQDFRAAVEPGWPLIYVDPTPSGTLLLCVQSAGDSVSFDGVILREPSSLELWMRLAAGNAADDPSLIESGDFGYYLGGASGGFGTADLSAALDETLPWIGSRISRPVHEILAAAGASGVTLIPCGPVQLAPVHAAPFSTRSQECLLDHYAVRYAPSAVAMGISRRRAAARRNATPRFVGLADPKRDLPASGPEVSEISQLFPEGAALCALNDAAKFDFLQAHGPSATHLHFACHAGAEATNADAAAIQLANRTVHGSELAAIGPLQARVVSLSACQTAVAAIDAHPDEVLSLSTVMLGAGAAASIASLWSVDDAAAALLMVKTYEHMLQGESPPEALRRAQLWLRELKSEDAKNFLDEHQQLAAEIQRRRDSGEAVPRNQSTGEADGSKSPFSWVGFWAPFIAVGA